MKTVLLRYLWGIVSVGIYLLLIGLLFFYFNHRTKEQRKHYVKKDEHRIQVGLSSPAQKTDPQKRVSSAIRPKQTKPLKRPTFSKSSHKKVIKERVVKKSTKKKPSKPKPKKKAKDLFKHIKTEKKPLIKVTDKPIKPKPKKRLFEMKERRTSASERIKESLKEQKNKDSGIENSYLAHVQEMLEGWPAQSDFAGEKVKVHLKIDPTGHFEFIIKRKSRNPEFNRALSAYLKQLQEFGFGPHKGSRTYLFEAEFIAKE